MAKKCTTCHRQTNDPTGQCVICRIEGTAPAGAETTRNIVTEKKEELKDMTAVAKEKICVDCSKPYQPRSNVQKRCDACGAAHKTAKKLAGGGKVKGLKKQKKLTPTKTQKSSSPDINKLIITIDLLWYPKLMQMINPLDSIDGELPERVVQAIIHKHLTQLEERA